MILQVSCGSRVSTSRDARGLVPARCLTAATVHVVHRRILTRRLGPANQRRSVPQSPTWTIRCSRMRRNDPQRRSAANCTTPAVLEVTPLARLRSKDSRKRAQHAIESAVAEDFGHGLYGRIPIVAIDELDGAQMHDQSG